MAISVEKAVIAKLTKGGKKFEILVDPEKALELKSGKEISIEDLLAAPEIYEDVGKGKRAGDSDVNKTFGTNDIKIISKKIVRDGEVQITTEQRKKMMEDKIKKIADIITKRGVNPQTNVPHPPERILKVIEQSKVKIDPGKRAEEQIDAILKEIQKIIPIKFEKIQIAIKVSAQYAGKTASTMRSMGTLIREEWKADGSYVCLLELAAGLQQELYDKLNNITHGDNEVNIIKKESV